MLIAASAGAPGQWRAERDAEICVGGTGVTSLDIAVCGRALARDDLSDLDRASVRVARGRALRAAGRLAAALADFDAALAHNPYSATAHHERARTLDGAGRYQEALADFAGALALSPRFGAAWRDRGIAHFYAEYPACARADLDAAAALIPYDADVFAYRGFIGYLDGRYGEAVDDFARVEALGLPYPYLPLWSFLARARMGLPAREVLVAARDDVAPGAWPQALIALYLGEAEADGIVVTLEDDASPQGRRRLAEAHFYVAALAGLRRRVHAERAHLERVLAVAEPRMPERVMAGDTLGPRKSLPPGGCPAPLPTNRG